ncbi:hypothetical protein J437_LFUL011628 [Ladona fulva]|uniref:Uncharacterized protein n=1 Tax=Ladona fulva TaxID=123851 RepID=A0A8K0K364_LADFU|nr:hypothetical protein J437_LFUL011628 [Ladona fulva]
MEKGVPEKCVRIVKEMYKGAVAQIRSSVGRNKGYPIRVRFHQGSALSPYIFNLQGLGQRVESDRGGPLDPSVLLLPAV